MNKFFVKLIWESPIGGLIYRTWDYFDGKREAKARRALILSQTRTVQVQEKSLLLEGIKRIKKGIKSSYDTKDIASGRVHHIEAIDFAKGDNEERAELLRKVYVYHDKDIKTETDKEKMVYKRIDHYKELHGSIEKRNLIRAIRKETNPEVKAVLLKQFNDKYLKER